MSNFTHFDTSGNAIMVDISSKPSVSRSATATGQIKINKTCFEAIGSNNIKKGDVLSVARLAGIMAVKQTPNLIPLCHTILIENASIHFEKDPENLTITAICTVKTTGATGVEMEALTGVSATLLTIYDMCKAVDKNMEILNIKLSEKTKNA